MAGYAGDLYDLSSPPKKRSRSSVLQQTRLLPNFEYVTLNKVSEIMLTLQVLMYRGVKYVEDVGAKVEISGKFF